MSKPPSPNLNLSVAERFRREIEKVEATGVARDAMLLRLTLGDAHKIKRDPELAVTDVGFQDGFMRFLGVKVEQGGLPVSNLSVP
ncbi:MAG: hypothetical protein JWM33_1131 [Caulobacteraceae bacterium]|nr:hypothetical protein [Caulobacteraceae bacterium]